MAAALARVFSRESSREFSAAYRGPASVASGAGLPAAVVPAVEVVIPEKQVGVPDDHVDTDPGVERDLRAAVTVQLVAIAVRRGVGRRTVLGATDVSGCVGRRTVSGATDIRGCPVAAPG